MDILTQDILAIFSGSIIGLTLGLIGGGGSVLSVPLLIGVVGVTQPHIAIGTSAVAVAVSAALNLAAHARMETVKWPCALVFAGSGIAGALVGAALGKATDGKTLLALFGLLMLIIAGLMLRPRKGGAQPDVRLTAMSARRLLPALIGFGLAVGMLSGFFGIGGGFLVVPGLIGATSMPILNAVGSSLVSVTAFGATTAISYALDGLVDWRIAGFFVLGGIGGGIVGTSLAKRLAARKDMLTRVFSGVVMAAGIYVVYRGFS